MAAILGPGDHLRQHNLPQLVRGDQLWRGTNYGVTGLLHSDGAEKPNETVKVNAGISGQTFLYPLKTSF